MHAQTMVTAKGGSVTGKLDELKQQCPSCSQRVVVTNGDTKTRVAWDDDDERFGFRSKAEYFDCDMNVAKGNTRGRMLMAFLPYNKNPKTPVNSVMMGLRQIVAFLALYPRVEKCGAMLMWSQSKNNPTKQIDVSFLSLLQVKSSI